MHRASMPVAGDFGKIDPAELAAKIAAFPQDAVHHGRATCGHASPRRPKSAPSIPCRKSAKSPPIAKKRNLPLHMDGARFANALVALDATPAEMTWKRGVDILSFGGTKNGCWCAEAIVFFNPGAGEGNALHPQARRPALLQVALHLRPVRRLFPKMASGSISPVTPTAWPTRLRAGIGASNSARLAWPTASNEVFAVIQKSAAKTAEGRGAKFYEWPIPAGMPDLVSEGETLVRLVTSFATTEADVDGFLKCLLPDFVNAGTPARKSPVFRPAESRSSAFLLNMGGRSPPMKGRNEEVGNHRLTARRLLRASHRRGVSDNRKA